MTHLLLRDIDIVDGAGAPHTRGDVGIRDGRIAEIAPPGTIESDASVIAVQPGSVLAPGFIDTHAHSDLYLLAHPDHFPKITQGVTTEVIGQLSYAPIDDAALAVVRKQIAGGNGNPGDFAFDRRTVAHYLARLDQGITPNAAYLVPQGMLRMLVVGGEQRVATTAEIDRMCALLAEGFEQGRGRDVQRAHLHARNVRRHRRTRRVVRDGRGTATGVRAGRALRLDTTKEETR
ncbi:hypothetical protein ACTWPB_18365 [Nocardia sp. IBHARD005]|uniref:hypothetical protein n=1 Tax=Nocardia sp. IBHARD005 TaxID=3457765 RepID=UPI004058FDCE